jgi:RNA polymerase sigma factor (sigma-70 family)
MAMAVHEAAAREFAAQRHALWGFCYRMTGSAADADALIQETFVRVLERPPSDLSIGWGPSLARTAAAHSIDALRLRQHRAYIGSWLPAPIETGSAIAECPAACDDGGTTYGEIESLTTRFLIAIEPFTPRQRAVLLLRAVFGYSIHDAAQSLELTYANVKSTLQKARQLMRPYDADRPLPTREAQARVAALLNEFLERLQRYDAAAVEAMLATDARAITDSAGEFVAPTHPVCGRERIVRLLLKMAERRGPPTRYAFRMLNAFPALVAEVPAPAAWAPRFVFRIDVNSDGLISELHTITATRKLAAVSFNPA